MKKIILLLLAFVLIFACSKNDQIVPAAYAMKSFASGMDRAAPTPASFEGLALQSKSKERKLKQSASLSLRVESLEDADKKVNAILEGYDAYSASTGEWENSLEYNIKVPRASYEAILKSLEALGKTTHKSQSSEDVTLQYYDLENKLDTKLELLKTFRSYLREAKNIDEIMQVETRLAELSREIEWMGSEFASLAALVDYASINLNLTLSPSLQRQSGKTFGDKISDMFSSFTEFLSSILVVLLGIVIYGVPILAVLIVLYIVFLGRFELAKKFWRLINFKKPEA
ncbi:MAG: hypothetical protein Ta2G_08700 [Termitinemataceae bacterium]|nr:MAG: hypothetical protein Ta2G_08700 [Termitinemataceae bacterium]